MANLEVLWTPDVTSGVNPTLDVGCGAKAILTNEGAAPASTLFAAGISQRMRYNGTAWIAPAMVNTAAGASATGNVSIGATVASANFLGSRVGLKLSWADADTISISAGGCVTTGGTGLSYAGGNTTFAALDTGTRTLGLDYAAFLTASGIKLTAISTYHAGGLAPSGLTTANTCLLGYFHNGKSIDNANAQGAIFQYSVTSNDNLDRVHPYRATADLPAGVPLPGMVKVGNLAVSIYKASREDATSSSAGSSTIPVSRYGVVPWVSIQGWEAMQVTAQSGTRLPTWAEWLMAATFNPGNQSGARMNGNTDYGSASDDTDWSPPAAPTVATGAAGVLTGAYYYRVTFTTANGETYQGTASAVVDPASQQVSLTGIPTGAAGATGRKIYRTVAGGSTYYLLATIADNVTTTYTDNTADGSLGAQVAPTYNTSGAQQGANDPTCNCGRSLVGTGPRTSNNGTTTTGRSWYAPSGIADPVGNAWEWVAQFFGGLQTSSPSAYTSWGFESDGAWNFLGQAYNPDTGGWASGLPSLLFVGGDWSNGSYAGVRAANANYSAGGASIYFGFRSVR